MDSQLTDLDTSHQNSSQRPSQFWIAPLYVAAFFCAAVALVFALYTMPIGFEMRIDTVRVEGPGLLFDAGILVVLGVAAYKRQLWGGYGLILHTLLDTAYKFTNQAFQGVFFDLILLPLFVAGTFHLSRLKRLTSSDVTYNSRYSGKWIRAAWTD
jgi:hypothetical protein